MTGLEFVEGHPLLFQVLRSEDKVASLGILFHNLSLCLHLLQVLYQPVNAKCLLEDSDRLDVIGVILGASKDFILCFIFCDLKCVEIKVVDPGQ